MAWNDVAFRVLGIAAEMDPESALNSQLIFQAVTHGHFAIQSLSIRRMMDRTKAAMQALMLVAEPEGPTMFARIA